MFKTENVYFIQGHGDTIRRAQIQNTTYGPISLEFDRFPLPENVFTASSREVGLNTPPDDEVVKNFLKNKNNLLLPQVTSSYGDYTKQLRDLGKELFKILIQDGDIQPMAWRSTQIWKSLVADYGKPIPEIIHTHGPTHKDFSSQPAKEYRRDLFLFSAPNDTLELGTHSLRGNGYDRKGSTSNLNFTIWNGWFVSGIAPLDELAARDPKYIESFLLVMPAEFFRIPMNEIAGRTAALSCDEIADWKDLIKQQYASGAGPDPKSLEYTISELKNDEFKKQIVDLFLNRLKSCYCWGPTYESEETFLEKPAMSLKFNMDSKEVIDAILRFRQKKGMSEPILVLFYHCRTLGSDPGNVYGKPFEKLPSISRSLSTSAATGVENTTLPSNVYFQFKKEVAKYKDEMKKITTKKEYLIDYRAKSVIAKNKLRTLEADVKKLEAKLANASVPEEEKAKLQEDITRKQKLINELKPQILEFDQKNKNQMEQKTKEIQGINEKEVVGLYKQLTSQNQPYLEQSNIVLGVKLEKQLAQKQQTAATTGGKRKTKRRTKRKSSTRRK